MPSNSANVCVDCREVFKQTAVCPKCGNFMMYMGSKWRAPKRSNGKAWKRIASGDLWWDKKAAEKKPRHRNPWLKEWRDKKIEEERRVNKKYRVNNLT